MPTTKQWDAVKSHNGQWKLVAHESLAHSNLTQRSSSKWVITVHSPRSGQKTAVVPAGSTTYTLP